VYIIKVSREQLTSETDSELWIHMQL